MARKYRYQPFKFAKNAEVPSEREGGSFHEEDTVPVEKAKGGSPSGNVFAVLILTVLVVFMGGILFLPKPTESVSEKRTLAAMPKFSAEKLFSGEYTRELSLYVADTFPLREQFVKLSAYLTERRGLRTDNVRLITAEQPPKEEIQQLPAVSGTEESSVPELPKELSAPPDANAQGVVNNGILVVDGHAMSLFGANPDIAKRYAAVISEYQALLPDVQVYNMIVPTASEYNLPPKYASMSASQAETIQMIYDALDPKIKRVDACGALEKHRDEYLYFRTDHHWTGLGAYYAYMAFCEQAGVEPVSLGDTERRRLENFIGTMYAQAQDSTMLKNPDYVDYFLLPTEYTAQRYDRGAPYYPKQHSLWGEYAKSPNSYSVFLHGDYPLIHVKTEHQNGRKIMMVKESFGNAFAPFLISHYEEVFIVDQRYFEPPVLEFIKEQGINELLFANNSFAACTTYHINCISNMKNGNFYVPPPAPEPVAMPETETVPPPSEPEERRGMQLIDYYGNVIEPEDGQVMP